MTDLLSEVTMLLAGLAVVVGLLVYVGTRDLRGSVTIFLEFLLAAGLLRLAVVDTWTAIGSVALVVVIRKVVVAGLRLTSAQPGQQ